MVPPCPRPLLAVTRTAANAGPRWNWEPHPLAEDLPRPYVRCTRTRPVPSRWTRPHPGGAIDGTSPFRRPLEDTGRRTPVARVPCTDRSPVICDTAGAAVHLGETVIHFAHDASCWPRRGQARPGEPSSTSPSHHRNSPRRSNRLPESLERPRQQQTRRRSTPYSRQPERIILAPLSSTTWSDTYCSRCSKNGGPGNEETTSLTTALPPGPGQVNGRQPSPPWA
jgi:hypothetical protein